MIEIITPDPWATVLTMRKESLAGETDVPPGTTLGKVSIPQLLRMADRYPHLYVADAVLPAEEAEYGSDSYYY